MDIETRRGLLLTFEIGPEYLMFVVEEEEGAEGGERFPQLKHIKNKKLSPGYLLLELSKCGIHLLPRNEDAAQADIKVKDFHAEERAINDVACAVRAFAFRSCKWNTTVDPENITIKIRENLEFDREFFEDHEPDWRYLMFWPNKVSFTRLRDTDVETPDCRIAVGQETHCLLTQCLEGGSSTAEALERTQQYSYVDFIDTVRKTLRLTRLLSFS